jgi:hypothetical protein
MLYDEFLLSLPDNIPNLYTNPLDYVLQNIDICEGVIIECGVASGGTIRKIANIYKERTIYGFDSFEGLPESWQRPDMNFDKGAFNQNNVLPSVQSNVKLIKGWYKDTLPLFASELVQKNQKIALLHVDCDIYSSTKCIFDNFTPFICSGTIIVFDELLNYPSYEKHEILAFFEFLEQNPNLKFEWIGKNGHVILNNMKDNGAFDQPVAIKFI